MNFRRTFQLPFLLLACFFLGHGDAHAQVKEADLLRTSAGFKNAFKGVVAKPSQSTVRVLCDGKETALGMIVGPDGWILTKANDLKGKIVCKLRNGQQHDAVVVGRQDIHDLALLKIDAHGLTPVEFKDSKKASVGDWAASVGTDDEPVAIGVISVSTRNVIMPKFAIGKSPPDVSKSGYLGVQLEPGDSGVRIAQVMPDTAAAKAGLKANDIVLALEGQKHTEPDTFIQEMAKRKPGEVVKMTVRRGEEEKDYKVTLGKRPPNSNRGDMQDSMGSALSSRRAGYPVILQHDAVIKPTDCGGPLVDLEGKVLGINVSRAGRTETWAIPTEVVQPLLFDLMSGKLAPKEIAGIKTTPVKQDKLADLRAAIKQLEDDKAALEKRLAELRTSLARAEAEAKAKDDKKTDPIKKTSSDPRPIDNSRSDQAVDRLLELMQQRLTVMTSVAKAKWNTKQPIADAEREKLQLIDLTQKGEALGLKRDQIERFFQAQFVAARRVQEKQHAAWSKSDQPAFEKIAALKDLRADIDRINNDLLTALAKLQPAVSETTVQERLTARAQSLLTGLSADVREVALKPLMVKKGN